jgi:geranylgeranyl reductase family protein
VGERYDVVVAGAGVAGAYAAFRLASAGLRVLVVDIKEFERVGDKPCGDAIGGHHLSFLGLSDLPRDIVEGYVKGIDIYSPSGRVRFRVLGEGLEVDRIGLARYLLKRAIDRGAEFRGSTAALEPIVSGGYVRGLRLYSGGRTYEVMSSVVVDATGNARAVVRRLPKDWPVSEEAGPRDFNIAYREVRVLKDEVEEPNILRIYVSKTVAPGGYWWFFPYSEKRSYVNVGLGVQGGRGYPHPRDLLYRYVLSQRIFEGSTLVEAGGAPVPTRGPLSSLVWNGIAVVGDAAYTVNPVHGGGKGSSMVSSLCVANAIVEALDRGDVSAEGLWEANICYMNNYGTKQAVLDVFRRFLQELGDEDLEFGMSAGIIKEEDLNALSLRGELELSVAEKAVRLLSGLRRPSLLIKLRRVAEYMGKMREMYENYPRTPSQLAAWRLRVGELLRDFEERVLGH